MRKKTYDRKIMVFGDSMKVEYTVKTVKPASTKCVGTGWNGGITLHDLNTMGVEQASEYMRLYAIGCSVKNGRIVGLYRLRPEHLSVDRTEKIGFASKLLAELEE